ncbi:MAG: phytanoyl-CoA dioxygenase family protein [Gemmatimonadetes bacterium]|nr:phytanoyl-CoA dioxygenase family protein [Gemmatimonadota bacterium]
MILSHHQKRFFGDFGYLALPGLMREEVPWIVEEFERVFREAGVVHDGTARSSLGCFIERSERLCALLDNPGVDGLLAGLLGEDYNYLGSGGELYVGDGLWHPDCHGDPVVQVKWAMYLDPLTRKTGALRLVPGSHRQGWQGNLDTRALWGIGMEEVPCVVPDNQPGDVIVFNQMTLHNALGGGNRRRMLNILACSSCRTETERAFLRRRLPAGRNELRWELMRKTATPERMRHLDQPWQMLA